MSTENRGGNPAPVYTVYPGSFQDNLNTVNYGVQQELLRQPPPKYEDVVRGEYLHVNNTNCAHTPPSTAQPINSVCGCACSHTAIAPPTSLPRESERCCPERKEEKIQNVAWVFFCILVLVLIFVWRMCIKLP